MCKTKIVATLGPASNDPQTIEKLILAGVNVVRLNFSHGSSEEHIARAELVRAIAVRLGRHVGVLADLQGPKIRIAVFRDGKVMLEKGQAFTLDADMASDAGTENAVGLDFPQLVNDVQQGDVLLLDDGRIRLKVTDIDGGKVHTTVLNAGVLSNRKGINLLGGGLSAPALTDKDKQDIITAAALDADYIAVSFPRNSADLHEARQLVKAAGCHAAIVAKVERAEVVASVKAMDDVILASDVIMVARGDLGVEIGDVNLPLIQKRLIERARYHGRPVITATQMMESMIENPMPTRAEVLDVANAVLDGTDAVMLSAESAAGKYPVEAVAYMADIASGAEERISEASDNWQNLLNLCSEPRKSMALAAMLSVSNSTQKSGVAIITEQGDTPRLMSRWQGKQQIWALSHDPRVLRQLALLRGVTPVYFEHVGKTGQVLAEEVKSVLYYAEMLNDIDSLILTQFESLENVGDTDICRFIKLTKAAEPVAA
ncbi:pyruvate kinase [Photobacterium lipolyticum]|uniref:Pyruvate kinase n=1 Tax=Photobacterium lipolyticum TaxID=266810 RepID=A0A2T3MVT1_9GAMM|nr:pyruvate kinase [Photobacterium lipolyticum]PSW04064.1 pyruvate kinase [Photobacterium lipolyticum]